MKPEWKDRLNLWIRALERDFYEPLGEISLEGFCTYDQLPAEQAEQGAFAPMPEGTRWGRRWEYCWMRGDIVLDARAEGQRIVMSLEPGGEATLYLDGEVFGTRRAEWVSEKHHFLCDQWITLSGKAGQRFHLLMEAYAGHGYPGEEHGGCATGPIRGESGEFDLLPDDAIRAKVGKNTFGIWHEDAYQLWLDVTCLRDLLSVSDKDSLRAAKLEEALEKFTVLVDFEQPREGRLRDYRAAREALKDALGAVNGSTAPRFSAVGNAHIDLSWLWPYFETERKVARTFAQQIRLMDLYPEYRYIQSQPQAYQICKERYPRLYERIREKIRAGQWIADGSMWVEPDTNMSGGEALIRQVLYGKRFYRDEFGVDCRTLWLPDTFGYSAVLPQILKGCGVDYLTTQKIFWTYNGSDPFPYHYFTWQGMDGSEVISFLHMDYTSRTDAATVTKRWKDRVQKRDLDRFMLPFGYGDGGGGPTRDHIEYVLREKDLEGVPRVTMEAPQTFFEDALKDGAPKNRYVGELYFQCHRGTYTSQAAVKKSNRKSELMLREAEMWSAASSLPYPAQALEQAWKTVLLNQFHDILPGSSIGKVYEEAAARYAEVKNSLSGVLSSALSSLVKPGSGKTWFNSLSWPRQALVKTENGYGRVTIPACGWTSKVDEAAPAHPVTLRMEGDGAVLENALLRCRLNRFGEIVELTDARGQSRISGPANVLRMYKDTPRLFDAWDIDCMTETLPVALEGESSLVCAENTPWRCAVRVKRTFANSAVTQEISLEADAARIEFATHISWHECHRLLKTAFPTGIHTDEGINEIQFGFVRRPTHRSRPYDADRFEVCNHRYTALCEENRGAAVLNDCKYGVSMLGDEIALTLLRAPTCPDGNADRGEHDFTYAYTFWDGPFAQCDVVRQGFELNVQPLCAEGSAQEASLIAPDCADIIIDTLKQAEDGSGDLIVRLYESKHTASRTRLRTLFPVKAAWACDMQENKTETLPCEEGGIPLAFRAFEIKTVRLAR